MNETSAKLLSALTGLAAAGAIAFKRLGDSAANALRSMLWLAQQIKDDMKAIGLANAQARKVDSLHRSRRPRGTDRRLMTKQARRIAPLHEMRKVRRSQAPKMRTLTWGGVLESKRPSSIVTVQPVDGRKFKIYGLEHVAATQ